MPDALVLDMPVELGLKLMPVVGADLPDPEWECSNHKITRLNELMPWSYDQG